MEKCINLLPNIVTGIRFVLVVPFLRILAENLGSGGVFHSPQVYVLIALICLTDLLDGISARRLNAQTALGAALDISADGFFIFSSFVTLNFYGVLPVWITAIAALHFTVFLRSSRILNRAKRECVRQSFVFDMTGRIAAVLFYLSPAAACLAWDNPGLFIAFVLNALLFVSVGLACVSIIKRILLCAAALRGGKQA